MADARTHLAVVIAAPDTPAALALAERHVGVATLVEYRLDLMADFDLVRLVEHSPLPAIITCRPPEEGGGFCGPERERRSLLREAIALDAAWVDVEAGALPELAALPRRRTRLIGSRHDFVGMLGDWASDGLRLRASGADVVKLVGSAHHTDDVLPAIAWLAGLDARLPGIGIVMGECGIASRLLAPRLPAAFLSFAAADGGGTAAGQLGAKTLWEEYGFGRVGMADPCLVLLCPTDVSWPQVAIYRQTLSAADTGGRAWLLPLPIERFGPGLLLACQLAGIKGIIALPQTLRDPTLADVGANPHAAAWRRAGGRWQALAASEPDPTDTITFVLTSS